MASEQSPFPPPGVRRVRRPPGRERLAGKRIVPPARFPTPMPRDVEDVVQDVQQRLRFDEDERYSSRSSGFRSSSFRWAAMPSMPLSGVRTFVAHRGEEGALRPVCLLRFLLGRAEILLRPLAPGDVRGKERLPPPARALLRDTVFSSAVHIPYLLVQVV